jgi:hypothetical protein
MSTVQVSDDRTSVEITKSKNSSIEVTSSKPRSSITVGVPKTSIVEKTDRGPSGPTGPTGPEGPSNELSIGSVTQGPTAQVSITGTSPSQTLNFVLPVGGNYTHNQISSSPTWTITHNLGFFPAVSVVDSGGNHVIGDVTYVSQNVVTVSFNSSFGGKAYLS